MDQLSVTFISSNGCIRTKRVEVDLDEHGHRLRSNQTTFLLPVFRLAFCHLSAYGFFLHKVLPGTLYGRMSLQYV